MKASRFIAMFAGAGLALTGCTGSLGGDPGVDPPIGGDDGTSPGGGAGGGSTNPGGGAGGGATTGGSGGAGGIVEAMPPPNLDKFECTPSDEGLGTQRLVKLTNNQFERTMAVMLSARRTFMERIGAIEMPFFEGTASTDRFSTLSANSINATEMWTLARVADGLSTQLVNAYKRQVGNCLSNTGIAFDACVRTMLGIYGPLVYQRPLTDAEINDSVELASGGLAMLGRDGAAGLAIEMLITSPYFLLRPELGNGQPDAAGLVNLTPYEIAASLSYSITGYPPDMALYQAAASGQLSSADQIKTQVARLVGSAGTGYGGTLHRFIKEYFLYWSAEAVFKDSAAHPGGDKLAQDTDMVVSDIINTNLRSNFVNTLLTSRVGFTDKFTYQSYNLTAIPGDAGRHRPGPTNLNKFTLNSSQRAGLLTQPSWLSGFSEMSHNLPVRRGKFIRESLLCGQVPAIPIDMIPPLPAAPTLREKLAVHSQGTCAGCHALMDPLGLPFEQYDDLGRFRTTEGGKAVVTTGEIVGSEDVDGPVTGPVDMMEKLGRSVTVRQCFARHAFRFFLSRNEQPADGCSLVQADKAYVDGGGNFTEFLSTLFTTRSFLTRTTK